MRILRHVCCVMIALGAVPVPPPKTLARAASVSREGLLGDALPRALTRTESQAWRFPPPRARARRSPASLSEPRGAAGRPGAAALVASWAPRPGVDTWRRADVAAAEGDATTMEGPAPAPSGATASSSAAPEETTTEESLESGDGDGDFGADFLNSLLEVITTLLSFFTDPPGAIQKMVEQAKQLTGGARSLMASVRAQRQAGLPTPEALPGYIEQFKKVVDAAIEVAKLGPEGARQARLMLQEAQRILVTAKGIVEASNRVANAARNVATSISRPWRG